MGPAESAACAGSSKAAAAAKSADDTNPKAAKAMAATSKLKATIIESLNMGLQFSAAVGGLLFANL